MKTGKLWKVEQSKEIEVLRDKAIKRDEQKPRVIASSSDIFT
jgi:hypothetical protein